MGRAGAATNTKKITQVYVLGYFWRSDVGFSPKMAQNPCSATDLTCRGVSGVALLLGLFAGFLFPVSSSLRREELTGNEKLETGNRC